MMHHSIEKKLGVLLLTGTLLSCMIVLIGGVLYLLQFGGDNINLELLQDAPVTTSRTEVWKVALSFTPLGIVQLGLLTLVLTQITRVAMLFAFYTAIRDYWFSLFCGIVLIVLIFSFF